MADPVITSNISKADGSVIQVVWSLTTADHTGTEFEGPEWADRTFQFWGGGTWGGATCIVEGINYPGSVYGQLSNAAGAAALSATTDSIKTVIELPRFMRPRLSIVGAGANVIVTMIARRANPMRT